MLLLLLLLLLVLLLLLLLLLLILLLLLLLLMNVVLHDIFLLTSNCEIKRWPTCNSSIAAFNKVAVVVVLIVL